MFTQGDIVSNVVVFLWGAVVWLFILWTSAEAGTCQGGDKRVQSNALLSK